MKTRNLIILTAVVALMAGYIYFYERHQVSTEEALAQANRVFPNLEQGEIRTVLISNEYGVTKLESNDGDWRLVEPLAYPADGNAVTSLIAAVAGLESERRLGADEVDPAAYGLDDPEMAVELQAADGTRFVLRVGKATPLGSSRAVATDAPGVLLCAPSFAVHLSKEPTGWRSRDVLEAFETDLASLDVQSGDDQIRSVQVNGAWRLLEPVEDDADQDYLRQVIADLNSLQIAEFIDDDPSPELDLELGLDQPRFRVSLVRNDGKAPTILELGAAKNDEQPSLIACRRDGSERFWVNDTIVTPLAKAPILWRSPKVLIFDTWDAASISVSREGAAVSATRADGIWSQDTGDEADFTKIQAVLRAVAELEARAYDLTQPTTPEIGRVEMKLEKKNDDEGTDPVSVVFFAPFSEGGRAMVTVSSRTTVMSIDVSDLDQILVGPGAFAPNEPEVTAPVPETSSESSD